MTTIHFKIKPFKELSLHELYQILALRNEVFIVEQNCVYQDVDFNDEKACHVIGFLEDKIVAYARIFHPNDYFQNASIGRVIVNPKHRGKDYGHLLMQKSIDAIESIYNEKTIVISAQLYLKKFYESHQFIARGSVYLEDNIEHIQMVKQ